MFEYDTQIALQEAVVRGDVLRVRFPNSAILYLRSKGNTPERLRIEIETRGGRVIHEVAVLRVGDYTIEEIFRRRLLFCCPFIFSHTKAALRCIMKTAVHGRSWLRSTGR